ncbi:hypothetical protein [Paraburkholderia sp. ZP32-5]|uniref:hypothetical protein n=1 Tax=Paraburkholderia sp. ZP32-5 TaxID=2883245 RepID=UPI001F3D0AFD|nr:hypothetical protein [Paraburkholderia sp. ZP32-5]
MQDTWTATQLAFVLLRSHFESLCVLRYELDQIAALQTARFTNALAGHLPSPAALQAMLFAAYAALVIAARGYVRQRRFDYRVACEIPTNHLSLVAVDTNSMQCGAVIAPDPGDLTGDLFGRRGLVNPEVLACLNASLEKERSWENSRGAN